MFVFEVVCGGDRRSLIKRFERKSKHDAICELVDFHLLHCSRIEKLEQELAELSKDKERLDSGVIMTHDRDEFGENYQTERRGVNLRADIDEAIKRAQRDADGHSS